MSFFACLTFCCKLARLLLVCGLLLNPGPARADKPLVVTSIRPLALIVRDLAGERVKTRVLLPPSVSPHDFSLTISQALMLSEADLLVWVGPDFETFLSRGVPTKSNVAMAEAQARIVSHDHSKLDLHLWLSYRHTAALADALAPKLSALLPEFEPEFAERRRMFKHGLNARAAQTADALAPYANRPFAVYHDAYRYFVEEYGLNQALSLTSVPHESLSAKKLAEVGQAIGPARCLLAEASNAQRAKRYAMLFEKRLVTVDLLAVDGGANSYNDYVRDIADAFLDCLAS